MNFICLENQFNLSVNTKILSQLYTEGCTVYPKKYAHGFVVLCFVVVM